jgi:phenylalanyl-tRNA synthetase beta chain
LRSVKVFLPQPDALLPLEKEMLVGLWTGPREKAAWHTKETACDFFDIKGVVEGMALALGITALSFAALPDDQCCYTRAGHTAQVLHSGQMVGIVGEVDTPVADNYSLRRRRLPLNWTLEMVGQLFLMRNRWYRYPVFPQQPGI